MLGNLLSLVKKSTDNLEESIQYKRLISFYFFYLVIFLIPYLVFITYQEHDLHGNISVGLNITKLYLDIE